MTLIITIGASIAGLAYKLAIMKKIKHKPREEQREEQRRRRQKAAERGSKLLKYFLAVTTTNTCLFAQLALLA